MSSNLTRPTLPIGWLVDGKISVKDFVDRIYFTEIYDLGENEFLYVFQDTQVISSIEDRKVEVLRFSVGAKDIVAKRYEGHNSLLLKQRLREIRERVGLDAVAGMNELKSIITRDVIHPFLNRENYLKYKVGIPNGILLFGPPGCGKTFIANRIAEAMNVDLLEVKESDIGSMYIHGTTANIARVFKAAAEKAPCVIFFDEISGFLPSRESISFSNQYKESEVNEFLVHLESAGSRGILVIGATNYPDRIDSAVLRSGRMDKRVYIPPPDYEARLELFKIAVEGRPLSGDFMPEILARESEGFVSSDIKLIVDNSARRALHDAKPIMMEHLLAVMKESKPSLDKKTLQEYERFLTMERK
jgi:transitional endoplasmic reticulum ATPase